MPVWAVAFSTALVATRTAYAHGARLWMYQTLRRRGTV